MAKIKCFHCQGENVIWDNDFSFEEYLGDFGYDGDGIVHVLHCPDCGARIEYCVPELGTEYHIEVGGEKDASDARA